MELRKQANQLEKVAIATRTEGRDGTQASEEDLVSRYR
jgi:hypothetical protein